MVDRPIIFSGPMVRTLLDGRKTQTRRLATSPLAKCQPGDRLWVREAWAVPENWGSRSASDLAKSCLAAGYERPWAPIHYLTDGSRINWGGWRQHKEGKGRPSIHMPRWASRLTLTVTEARRQRLHELTEADAVAEGIAISESDDDGGQWWSVDGLPTQHRSAGEAYAALWDHLHGPGQWTTNPEIVALTFTVHYRNIDAMPATQLAAAS